MAKSKEAVLNALSNIANDEIFQDIQMGIFGSYARNEQNDMSDIDVVLKSTHPIF